MSGVKAVASSPKLLSRSARVGHRGNKAACEVCHRAPASQSPVVVRAAADVEAPPTSDMQHNVMKSIASPSRQKYGKERAKCCHVINFERNRHHTSFPSRNVCSAVTSTQRKGGRNVTLRNSTRDLAGVHQ